VTRLVDLDALQAASGIQIPLAGSVRVRKGVVTVEAVRGFSGVRGVELVVAVPSLLGQVSPTVTVAFHCASRLAKYFSGFQRASAYTSSPPQPASGIMMPLISEPVPRTGPGPCSSQFDRLTGDALNIVRASRSSMVVRTAARMTLLRRLFELPVRGPIPPSLEEAIARAPLVQAAGNATTT